MRAIHLIVILTLILTGAVGFLLGAIYGPEVWVKLKPISRVDCLEFVRDVTIPDGSVIRRGESFTKKWAVKNCGNTIWTNFRMVKKFGTSSVSGAPVEIEHPDVVIPGQETTVSVPITAPDKTGTFIVLYSLDPPETKRNDILSVVFKVE